MKKKNNSEFNYGLKNHIDYFDPVTTDSPQWDSILKTLHPNLALRSFERKSYHRTGGLSKTVSIQNAKIELIYPENLANISYKNKEMLNEWFNFPDLFKLPKICLAVIIIKDNTLLAVRGLTVLLITKLKLAFK